MWGSGDDADVDTSSWGFSMPSIPTVTLPDIAAPSLSLFSEPTKAMTRARSSFELKNELDSLMALQASLAQDSSDDESDLTDVISGQQQEQDAEASANNGQLLNSGGDNGYGSSVPSVSGRNEDSESQGGEYEPTGADNSGASAGRPSGDGGAPRTPVASRSGLPLSVKAAPRPSRETTPGNFKVVVEGSLYATDGEKAARDQLKGRKAMASLGQKAREEFLHRQRNRSLSASRVANPRTSPSPANLPRKQLAPRLLQASSQVSVLASASPAGARSSSQPPPPSRAAGPKQLPKRAFDAPPTPLPRSPAATPAAAATHVTPVRSFGGDSGGRGQDTSDAEPDDGGGNDSDDDLLCGSPRKLASAPERSSPPLRDDETTALHGVGDVGGGGGGGGDGERIQVVVRVRPVQPRSQEEDDYEGRCVEVSRDDTTSLFLLARPNAIPFKFDYVAGEVIRQWGWAGHVSCPNSGRAAL